MSDEALECWESIESPRQMFGSNLELVCASHSEGIVKIAKDKI